MLANSCLPTNSPALPRQWWALIALLSIALGMPQATAQQTIELSAEAESVGQLSRAARYVVDFRISVTPPAGTELLQVWLPLAPDNRVQQVSDRRIETFPRGVPHEVHREPVFGNRFAYFEFQQPQGAQLITQRLTAVIHQVDWEIDYTAVQQPERWPESFDSYRRLDPRSQPGQSLASVWDEIRTASDSSSDRLIRAMNWVDQNLTYDHAVASLTADPMHALIHRRGHCSDYHGLCSTLAQKIGYPSRVAYGLQMFDQASPSHCKLQVFLPPYGWVTYDLSETQKLTLKTAADRSLSMPERQQRIEAIRSRTMRGFQENTWLQVTRGTNYQLAPPASRPVTVVRTIYAEADGVPLPDPDPSSGEQSTFAIMTMYRVDGDDQAKRFQVGSF